MTEIIPLFAQCLWSWLHGFGTKTGAEPWFARQSMWVNNQHLRAAAAKRIKHEK